MACILELGQIPWFVSASKWAFHDLASRSRIFRDNDRNHYYLNKKVA